MGQISVGTPIDSSLIRCCSCRKGYDIKGNIYENNILVCPCCGLKHKIGFTFVDKKIENLEKIHRLSLGAIDIGSSAVAGSAGAGTNKTVIVKDNPANASGKITSVQIYSRSANTSGQNLEVATFYRPDPTGFPNKFTTRDTEYIGDVNGVGQHSYDVDLDVQEGDYIGFYYNPNTASIGLVTTGYSGLWYTTGDLIPCTNATHTPIEPTYTASINGTGTTAAADFTYTGTGSFTYNGAATQVYTTNFLYTGSGSLTYSGAYSRSHEYTGSGEFTCSGSAVTVIGFTYVGTGELTYSGTATQTHTYVASGDFTFSGVATYSYFTKYSCVGSGAYSFSGIGTYILGFASVGSGVLVYSGAADFPVIRPATIYYLVSKATTTYYERTVPVLTSYVVSIPSSIMR